MKKIDWVPAVFLVSTLILAVILTPIYFWFYDLTWPIATLTVFYWLATGLSITAGYHRLFSHRSYKAKKWLQALYLFFGAGAFQNSALKWCTEHRQHHRRVDTDDDPYSINKGATYAHIGWMMTKPEYKIDPHPRDLTNNKLVMFQHNHYYSIAFFAGFVVPWLAGMALGDPLGGLILAGLARLVVVHHSTFFVNSLAHIWGSRPYSLEDTARDNIVVAFLTYGEGYHNFHHKFEADYRNGIKWYHFDPTKWWIKSMAWLGQASQLRKVPDYKILQAKIEAQYLLLKQRGTNISKLQSLKSNIEEAQARLNSLKREYASLKSNLSAQSKDKIKELKIEIRLAKIEFKARYEQWKLCVAKLPTAV